MRNRCNNQNEPAFKDYGGRGIKVCERWDEFQNFLADMGPRPSLAHSLDRYPDVNGNYEPGNCRWATDEQQQNNKRNSHMITFGGKTQTIAQWTAELGYRSQLINCRVSRGETDPQRLLEPPRIGVRR